jgi:hypothetical protein
VEGSGEMAGRTAVIVIAGVGDRPQNSAAADAARQLLSHGHDVFAYAESQDEAYSPSSTWYAVTPEDQGCQQVTRYTLYDHQHTPRVDVYEAWWADLSRFPGATRSALLATVGMLFQITAVGRAALRGGPALSGRMRSAGRGRGFAHGADLLGLVEWLVAVPVVTITVLTVALLGLGDYALTLHADTWPRLGGFCLLAALLVGATLWFVLRWYPERRSNVPLVGLPLLAGTIAVGIWRSLADGRSASRGVADTIFALSVYPFRAVWMLVAALALAILVGAVARLVLRRGQPIAHPWARVGTAGLSSVGPFGLAIVFTLVYAAAGNALQKVAEGSTFPAGNLWCLQAVNDWKPGACTAAGSVAAPLSAFDWGRHLVQLAITPLLYVTAAMLAALLLAGLLGLLVRAAGNSLLERTIRLAPWTMAGAVVPSAVLVILAWLPLGDHVLVWHGWFEPWQTVGRGTAVGAVVLGYAVSAMLLAARSLKLGSSTLLNRGTITERLRLPLDLAYDIASYLREPSLDSSRWKAPREKMLARIAGLLEHVSRTRAYDHTVFLTHSQGTVLATALLNDPDGNVTIPGGRTTLVTMGSPLRNLYANRLPEQFAWADRLAVQPDQFVRRVDTAWVNFFVHGDLVGRRLFSDEHQTPTMFSKPYQHGDVDAGPGTHGSYWTSSVVFQGLIRLIDL